MQIVEEHDVDPSVKRALIALNIRLDRRRADAGSGIPLHRNVDQREAADLLAFAIFKHLKVVNPQVGHEGPLLIGDQCINFDVFDLRLEGRARIARGLSRLRNDNGAADHDEKRGECVP